MLPLLSEGLGTDWLSRHHAEDLIAELGQLNPPAFPRRQSSRVRMHALHGQGLSPPYVALALENLPEATTPGWRILQALILVGALLRRGNGRALGQCHLEALAQFLSATLDEYQPSIREDRDAFLAALGSEFDPRHIRAQVDAFAFNLPKGLVLATRAIVSALGPFRARQLPNRTQQKPRSIGTRTASTPGPVPMAPFKDTAAPDIDVVLGGTTQATPVQRRQATQEAESEAEQVPQALAGMVDVDADSQHHQRATDARRSFLDVRQSLWARNQWDALAPGEMREAMTHWLSVAEAALPENQILRFEAALLVLLVGATGWSAHGVWTTPFVSVDAGIPEGHERGFFIETGRMAFPVPGQSNRYNPATRGHADLVLPVAEQVQLDLPIRLVRLIQQHFARRADSGANWLATELPSLLAEVRSSQRESREKEPRETLARIRNAHLLGLLCQSHDLPMAQLASGELMGATDTGLCYLACRRSELQKLYDHVCETAGLEATSIPPDAALVGGSRLQLSTSVVNDVSAHNRAGLGQPNGHRDASAPEILRLHARYVTAVAWQLCAATGFRPGDSIGSVTIHQFSLAGRCMVPAEKVVDEGHLGRLVPLCPVIVQTLTAYGSHLEAMSTHPRLPLHIKEAAGSALSGQGPMFFMLENAAAVPLTGLMMRKRLPRGWQLPSNAFRHRLSSQLRTLGCPGVYVEALLGHVELGIQPFGRESFMDPAAFLDETSRCIQALMEQDGWKPLYGLATEKRSSWEPRPLGTWVLHLHANHTNAIEQLRAKYREAIDRFRESAGVDLSEKVRAAISAAVPDFFSKIGGRLDKDQSHAIRHALTASSSSLAEVQVTVETIRSVLKSAREERGWKIARMPFFYRGPVEASPFSPAFPSAYETFLRLRALFVEAVNGKSATMRSLTHEARVALALMLWHGVADWPRLKIILDHLHRGRPIRGLGDAVAIPYEIPGQEKPVETAEVLRGAVAMAVLPHVLAGRPINITRQALGKQLSRCIPSWVTLESGEKLVDILLSASQIAHFFEHPSPLRDVWTGSMTSVSAPFARVERLFADEPPIATSIESSSRQMKAPEDAKSPPALRSHTNRVHAEYKQLRPILRIRRGHAKRLPRSRTELPLGTPEAVIRREIIRELQWQREQSANTASVSGLLTCYALALLTDGTSSSASIKPQTVYNYVVGAGCSLVRVHPDADILSMDSEDILQIYGDAIDAAPKRYRPFMADYLSYFHQYLVKEMGAASADLRAIGGHLVGLPDVGWVAPWEYVRARELLTSPAQGGSIGSVRSSGHASLVLDLGYPTGARSAELVLRERRELVIEPGRQMLLIRANWMTSVKTKRAVRIIPLNGWLSAEQVNAICHSSASNARPKPTDALFPDQECSDHPVDPDLIAMHIGKALRAATGEPRARQYWLRHTAASMEFLFLFGDEFLLGALKEHASAQVPFPFEADAAQFAKRIGGSTVLSPVHAAAYRARRGHASIATSLASYVHALALIEPKASREATSQLTHAGLAGLIGRRPASVRQALHRAATSISDSAAVRNTLIGSSFDSTSRDQQPDARAEIDVAKVQPLSLASISRGIEYYLRTGNEEEAVRRMQVTSHTKDLIEKLLRDLPFRPLALPSPAPVQSHPSLFEQLPSGDRPTLRVGPRSIDATLLKSAFARMRLKGRGRHPEDAELWELLLAGFEPTQRIFRFGEIRDLELIATRLLDALDLKTGKEDMDPGEIVLVVDAKTTNRSLERDLSNHPFLKNHVVIRRNVLKSLAGYLPVALAYRSSGGRDRTMTLLFPAIAWRLWRQLVQAAADETIQPGGATS